MSNLKELYCLSTDPDGYFIAYDLMLENNWADITVPIINWSIVGHGSTAFLDDVSSIGSDEGSAVTDSEYSERVVSGSGNVDRSAIGDIAFSYYEY